MTRLARNYILEIFGRWWHHGAVYAAVSDIVNAEREKVEIIRRWQNAAP
jgi:hypothetical protein